MQLRALAQKPLLVILVSLIVAAWLSLSALEQSPFGQLMSHGGTSAHTKTQDSGLITLASFALGWAVMVVAMMLPTVLPFVIRFSRSLEQTTHDRHVERARSVLLLLGGYVLVWTAFGIVEQLALQASLGAIGLSPSASLLVGPAALILAGAYQFSSFKRRSIHRSCSPSQAAPAPQRTGFWGHVGSRVFLMGVREGAACIGCCWALMLLMLVGVTGGSAGMLVLGIVMYVEKNAPWGHRWVMPLGLFLIGLGLTLGVGSLLGTLPGHDHSMHGHSI